MSWLLEHPADGASPVQYAVYYAATPFRVVAQAFMFVGVLIAARLWSKAEKEEQ